MAQLVVKKGPGKFDLSVAYFRGQPTDVVRFQIVVEGFGRKSNMEVVADIHKAVPTSEIRDSWDLEGALMPADEHEAYMRGHLKGRELNWTRFKMVYSFKADQDQLHGAGQTLRNDGRPL